MYVKDVRVNLSQFFIDKIQTAIKSDHTPGVKRKIRVKSQMLEITGSVGNISLCPC